VRCVDCMCFVETFLVPNRVLMPSEYIDEDMEVFRVDRNPARGIERGGIMMMTKNTCLLDH